MSVEFVSVETPEVGDLATNVSGTLDARRVAEVGRNGTEIRLDFPLGPSGWMKSSNYTFKRMVIG